MLLHEFGNDFILALYFFLKLGDLAVFVILIGFVAFAGIVECGSAVFEEGLLPKVEEGGLELVLLADFGDRLAFEQVSSEQGDFFLRAIVLTWLTHEVLLGAMLTIAQENSGCKRGKTHR